MVLGMYVQAREMEMEKKRQSVDNATGEAVHRDVALDDASKTNVT